LVRVLIDESSLKVVLSLVYLSNSVQRVRQSAVKEDVSVSEPMERAVAVSLPDGGVHVANVWYAKRADPRSVQDSPSDTAGRLPHDVFKVRDEGQIRSREEEDWKNSQLTLVVELWPVV